MTCDSSPIENVFAEIEQALKCELFHAALSVALAIPDICVTLEDGSRRADINTYAAWVKQYLHHGVDTPTNRLLYKLRCGVFHNGILNHADMEKLQCSRVIYTVPGPLQVDGISINGAWCWAITPFCQRMISAGRAWFEEKKSDATVTANMDKVIRVRPEGLEGIITGMPILA